MKVFKSKWESWSQKQSDQGGAINAKLEHGTSGTSIPEGLARRYNALLSRFYLIESIVEASANQVATFHDYEAEWQRLANDLSQILNSIPNHTQDQALNGFDLSGSNFGTNGGNDETTGTNRNSRHNDVTDVKSSNSFRMLTFDDFESER